MKKIALIACVALAAFSSCKKDKEIGSPITIETDYVLPQTGASAEANAKIQAIHDKYGSFLLYDFDPKDALWVQSAGGSNPGNWQITLGDPANVGAMVDFLQEAWLDHFPDDFLREVGLPYRVFLADRVIQVWSETSTADRNMKITGKSFCFAGLNSIPTMTGAEKAALKNDWYNTYLWSYYRSNFTVPDEFYEVSDYVTAPTLPVGSYYPENLEAYRQRGFIPSGYYSYGDQEWYYNATTWESARESDFNSYWSAITTRTDEQMARFLDNYPLIKQKFDILVGHYKNTYGIDIRAIVAQTF